MREPKSLLTRAAEFLTREQAKALTDRVLSFARADETRVNVSSGWNGNTRFAGNEQEPRCVGPTLTQRLRGGTRSGHRENRSRTAKERCRSPVRFGAVDS